MRTNYQFFNYVSLEIEQERIRTGRLKTRSINDLDAIFVQNAFFTESFRLIRAFLKYQTIKTASFYN